jgi:hypothetical protein
MRTIGSNIFVDVEFASSILATHVANRTENRPLRAPRTVIAAQAPEDPAVRIGIATIECIPIVQFHHDFEGLLGSASPLDDLLSPQHTKVIMDSPFSEQLCLCSIPKCVMCLGTLKLLKSVNVGPLIARMLSKGLQSPRRQ